MCPYLKLCPQALDVSYILRKAATVSTPVTEITEAGGEWNIKTSTILIQYDREKSLWNKKCPEDGAVNSDLHCVSECGATARIRRATGLSLYFSSCSIKGMSAAKAYSNFVLGLDCKGEEISMADYRERGRTLAAVFKSVMGDHWGWSFLLLYYREPNVR